MSNARKSQNVKHNNGVGIEKKFTPPSPPLNHVSRGGWNVIQGGVKKKFRRASRAISTPHPNIPPPPRSFPRSAPEFWLLNWLNKINKTLPAEYTQHEVKHEEAANNNEGQEEDPVEHVADGIIRLQVEILNY